MDEVEIHLRFERSLKPRFHKNYHGDPERRKNRIVRILSDIYIRGSLSQKQKLLLEEELRRCPLHNTLTRPPELVEKIHLLEADEEMPESG